MPKVSVIIATYNRAHLLPETIQSVLDQSYRDYEVAVIDDGSTDNTAEIVSAFPVTYIRQENEGAPKARNRGIASTQSAYIVFLDSDDILLTNALAKGVEVLDTHPEVGFSYGQAYLIDQEGHLLGLRKRHKKHPFILDSREELKDLLSGCLIPSPTVMVRRSCLDEAGGYDPTFTFGSQDYELWVRLAKRHAVAYIREPLAKYRIHANTISATRETKDIEQSHRRILQSIFDDPEHGPSLVQLQSSTYAYLDCRLAGYAFHNNGEPRTARGYLFRAIKAYPSMFFTKLGLLWLSLFANTWLPLPLIRSFRRVKRYLRTFYQK